jgi:hypothetical protein
VRDFFKPEDFKFGDDGSPLSEATKLFGIKEESARTANAKLNALIESWPVVYGYKAPGDHLIMSTDRKLVTLIYSARLAFIKEMLEEPCLHEPELSLCGQYHKCKHCGVELVAEWRVK